MSACFATRWPRRLRWSVAEAEPVRILAISGSLRRESYNTALLRTAAALAETAEVVLHRGLRDFPPYDDDRREPSPAPAQRLREAILKSDAVLVATPEYNHSIPGHLKNALDWVSRPLAESPLRGKPAAVIGASTSSFGGVWAQAEMRKVLAGLGACVLSCELAVPRAPEKFDHGRLLDGQVERDLVGVVESLVTAAGERVTDAARA